MISPIHMSGKGGRYVPILGLAKKYLLYMPEAYNFHDYYIRGYKLELLNSTIVCYNNRMVYSFQSPT